MGWTGTNPADFVQKTEQDFNRLFRKVALDIFSRIIMRSPVDTGRFRGNWQVRLGSPAGGTLARTDKGGNATVAAASAKVARAIAGKHKITLTNNLPYGPALEAGHSKQQARAGMVGVTLTEFEPVVRQIAAEIRRV